MVAGPGRRAAADGRGSATATDIRDATANDAGVLSELFGALGYEVRAADIPARLERFETTGNGRVIVAAVDGRVAGLAAYYLTYPVHHATPVCYVSAFAVAEHARRRGVGSALLREIEHRAAASGCRRVVVTSAEHRSDAHAFYPANGWKYTGRRFGKEIERNR